MAHATVIIDYGCGNPVSIRNMLKKIGFEATVTSEPADIQAAERLILPGVGAFDHGMEQLESLALLPVLNRKVCEDGVPLLGICLGAQLLARSSEEGSQAGLGWIDAKVLRFDASHIPGNLKIPHMGWADVMVRRDGGLFSGFEDTPRFYFVHGYHLHCENPEDITATAWHGYDFPAAVQSGNIYGVQFHPEKSHRFGMTLLRNFMTGT